MRQGATHILEDMALKLCTRVYNEHRDSPGGKSSLECFLVLKHVLSTFTTSASKQLLQSVLEKVAFWQLDFNSVALSTALAGFAATEHCCGIRNSTAQQFEAIHAVIKDCEVIPEKATATYLQVTDLIADRIEPDDCALPGMQLFFERAATAGAFKAWSITVNTISGLLALEKTWRGHVKAQPVASHGRENKTLRLKWENETENFADEFLLMHKKLQKVVQVPDMSDDHKLVRFMNQVVVWLQSKAVIVESLKFGF